MVAKVIIIKDEKPIDQVVIDTQEMSIGRKSDCDITIKDPAVSGNHARIIVEDGMVSIEDLGSTNGVHIGGHKVQKQILKPGEVVTIGEHTLKFVLEKGAVGAVVKPAEPKPVSPPVEPTVFDFNQSYLKVENGADAGTKIQLQDTMTTVGEPGIQVAAVSKRPQGHFIIHVDGGKDKDKVPLVNGEPTGFKSRKLEAGDVIEIAGIQMKYCV